VAYGQEEHKQATKKMQTTHQIHIIDVHQASSIKMPMSKELVIMFFVLYPY
jgi:hypothetical protein